MRLTNYLLLTILMIAFAIYGFQEIGMSIQNSASDTAEKIRKAR